MRIIRVLPALLVAVSVPITAHAQITAGTFCVGQHAHRLYNGGGSAEPTYRYSVFRNWDTQGTKDWEIWKGPGAADIEWGTIEAVYKGNYAKGAKTLKVFSGVPTWASRRPSEGDDKYGTPGRKAGPKDLTLYENYVYEFVKHTNQYLWAVEGENEPHPEFSSMSMTELADSQKAVYQGAKRANPNIPVFSPAQSYLDDHLSQVMAAKTSAGEPIWKFFDAVAVHPYNSSGAGGPGSTLASEIANVRARMTAAGVPTTMPILDSEHGWGDWGPNIAGMSEEEQGQVVYNTVKAAKELGLVSIMLYSHDNDYPYIGKPMSSTVVSKWLDKAYADFDTCNVATTTAVTTTSPTVTSPATVTPAAAAAITAADLATHNTAANCWVGYAGTVYDLSAFLPGHAGTAAAITPYCGMSTQFEAMLNAQHGAANAAKMLTTYAVAKGPLAGTANAAATPVVTTTAAPTVAAVATPAMSTSTPTTAIQATSTGAASVGQYTSGPVPVAAPAQARSAYTAIAGLAYNDANGIRNGNDHTGYFDNRDWIAYKNIDFGTSGATGVTFDIAENPEYAGGTVELHLDSRTGTKIGELKVNATGGWYTFTTQSTTVSKATGVHDLYLVARGGWGVANIRAFVFSNATNNNTVALGSQVCAPTTSTPVTPTAPVLTPLTGTTTPTNTSVTTPVTSSSNVTVNGNSVGVSASGTATASGTAPGTAGTPGSTPAGTAASAGISPTGICGLTPVYIAPATGNWLADWNNGPVYGWPPGTKAENTTMVTLPSGETAVSIGMKKEADGVVSVGAINSQGKYHVDGALGGYFEFQAKWSMQGGPSGWLLSEDYEPGGHLDRWEIDVIERFLPDGWQGGGYNIMHSTGHSPDRMDGSDIDTGVNLSSDFHTYAVDWYPGKYIRWYFDGKQVKEITDGGLIAAGGEPFAAVFNTAIGESGNNTVQGLFGDPANVGTTNDPTLIKGVKMYNRTSETGGVCAGAGVAAGTTVGIAADTTTSTGVASGATASTAATTVTTTGAGTTTAGTATAGSAVAVGAGIPTPTSLAGLTASGPITATSGQTITGLKITNPNGPCITVEGSNVKITGNEIGPCRGGIIIRGGSNISVDHNYIHDTTTWNGAQEADFDGPAVQSSGASNVTVAYNYMEDVTTGYYAEGGGGIVMDHNYVKNVHGSPRSRGNIDRIGGQMAQYNGVNDAGSKITCNMSDQVPGEAWTEDHINTWTSKGTAADPLLIAYNKIRGYGPSMSNGGIIAGDGASQYIVIRNNNVIDAGGYGVAIAGGSNNTVTQNKIVGDCPRCAKGMYVHDYSGGGCTDNEMSYNRVRYRGAPGEGTDWGAESLCPNTKGVDTNILNDQTLNAAAMWAEVFPEC